MATLDPKDLNYVWECFTSIYGAAFTNSFGAVPSLRTREIWGEGLAGFTRAQLHKGMTQCSAIMSGNAGAFPPSLPQFRALCLGSHDAPQAPLTDAQRHARQADEQAYDIAHLQRMRELANGLGLDLWAKESVEGIPHRVRPHYGPTEYGRESMKNLGRFLQAFGHRP